MIVKKLVIHHSYSDRDTTKMIDIAKWHKDKGFGQVGYHKVINGKGDIIGGRPESFPGAHARGANHDSLGVCVTGNFEKELPDNLQINSLVKVLIKWCADYNLNETIIFGHYNVPGGSSSLCPGKNLISRIFSIKVRVRDGLAQKK